MQATASDCRPTIKPSTIASDFCITLLNRVFVELLPNHQIDLLIVSARWNATDSSAGSNTSPGGERKHSYAARRAYP
jgi:hypothetical protein